MQVAMHNWMRAEPIEVTIARLAKCGYDAIEISGEPERYDTKHVGKLLKDHKLTCWGSVTLMMGDRNLLTASEANRAMSVKYVKDTITMVKELGGQEITIVPCTVGKLTPEASPEEEWRWAVESLKQCYEHGLRKASASRSSRSTASRRTSSAATIRRCCSPRPSARTAASVSTRST
jgi:sugar phosphate isomerase/epimerase